MGTNGRTVLWDEQHRAGSIPMPHLPDEDTEYERHRQKLLDAEMAGAAGNEQPAETPLELLLRGALLLIALLLLDARFM